MSYEYVTILSLHLIGPRRTAEQVQTAQRRP